MDERERARARRRRKRRQQKSSVKWPRVILAIIGAIGTVLCYTYLRISKKEYDKLRQYNAVNENNGD